MFFKACNKQKRIEDAKLGIFLRVSQKLVKGNEWHSLLKPQSTPSFRNLYNFSEYLNSVRDRKHWHKIITKYLKRHPFNKRAHHFMNELLSSLRSVLSSWDICFLERENLTMREMSLKTWNFLRSFCSRGQRCVQPAFRCQGCKTARKKKVFGFGEIGKDATLFCRQILCLNWRMHLPKWFRESFDWKRARRHPHSTPSGTPRCLNFSDVLKLWCFGRDERSCH